MRPGQSDDQCIAGTRRARDWKDLRRTFDAGDTAERWKAAIQDYFLQRLETRYLKPIRVLRQNGSRRGEGFSIVTLQCALIEFLAAMRTGKLYVQGVPETDLVYSSSKRLFVGFLTTVQPFQAWFQTEDEAIDFYSSVRCGLMHEARTKGLWQIGISGSPAINVSRTTINRDALQDEIGRYIEGYAAALETDAVLQRAFIRKLDDIAV